MAHPRLKLAPCVLLFATSCAGGSAREDPRRPVASARPEERAPPIGIADRHWGPLASQSAGVELLLPERDDWAASEARGWLRARHSASDLSVSARSWRAEGVVNRRGCELEARRHARDLPQLVPEAVFASEALGMPPGFDTHAELGVITLPNGSVEGVLSVFGAETRRCIALLAVTRAEGSDAERVVVTRLGLLATGTARTLRPRGIEDRVRQR